VALASAGSTSKQKKRKDTPTPQITEIRPDSVISAHFDLSNLTDRPPSWPPISLSLSVLHRPQQSVGEIPSIRFLVLPLVAECGWSGLLLKLKYYFSGATPHKGTKNPGKRPAEEVGVLRCTQPSRACTRTWPFMQLACARATEMVKIHYQ
jgi:hypothetical protein